MKPFMKYPGGKTNEAPLVVLKKPHIIKRYFEPFVGGGSIYLELDIHPSYINDFSFDLINLYKLLKENNSNLLCILHEFDNIWKILDQKMISGKDLINLEGFKIANYKKFYEMSIKRKKQTIMRLESEGNVISSSNLEVITTTARKTAFYMQVRDIYNKRNVDNLPMMAATYYFLREYCYSSMFRFSKDGNFNVPYGGMSYNNKYLSSKIDIMFGDEIKNHLKDTSIYNMDFEEFLNQFSFNEDDFIFLDPPYDTEFSTYDQNTFDKQEQIRLRDTLKNVSAKWMLIIKKTDFISELYKDFNIYEYEKSYMVSFKNRNSRNVEHLLITNYSIKEE